jgi:hypothetical protein
MPGFREIGFAVLRRRVPARPLRALPGTPRETSLVRASSDDQAELVGVAFGHTRAREIPESGTAKEWGIYHQVRPARSSRPRRRVRVRRVRAGGSCHGRQARTWRARPTRRPREPRTRQARSGPRPVRGRRGAGPRLVRGRSELGPAGRLAAQRVRRARRAAGSRRDRRRRAWGPPPALRRRGSRRPAGGSAGIAAESVHARSTRRKQPPHAPRGRCVSRRVIGAGHAVRGSEDLRVCGRDRVIDDTATTFRLLVGHAPSFGYLCSA